MNFFGDFASSVVSAFQPLFPALVSAASVVATQFVKAGSEKIGAKIPPEAKPFVNLFLAQLIAQWTGADPAMSGVVAVAGGAAFDANRRKLSQPPVVQ